MTFPKDFSNQGRWFQTFLPRAKPNSGLRGSPFFGAAQLSALCSKAHSDMSVEVGVETLVNFSKRQKELLAEFETEGKGKKTSPESEGFFSRVKEFWEDLTE